MPKPKKSVGRRKAKIPIKARVSKKDSVRRDALRNVPSRLPPDVGANFRIRLKKR